MRSECFSYSPTVVAQRSAFQKNKFKKKQKENYRKNRKFSNYTKFESKKKYKKNWNGKVSPVLIRRPLNVTILFYFCACNLWIEEKTFRINQHENGKLKVHQPDTSSKNIRHWDILKKTHENRTIFKIIDGQHVVFLEREFSLAPI